MIEPTLTEIAATAAEEKSCRYCGGPNVKYIGYAALYDHWWCHDCQKGWEDSHE